MKIKDIRLLQKDLKRELSENYSAEFAYVLAEKIKQPIYRSKRGKKTKYFVGYFNYDDKEIKLADINKVMVTDKINNYEMVNPKHIVDDLNVEKIEFFKDILKDSFKKVLTKEDGDFKVIVYSNDIYTTDLPFRRDIVLGYRFDVLASIAYISGLKLGVDDIHNISPDDLNSLIDSNSDCKKLALKYECKYRLLKEYLMEFYAHNFIDSIFVRKQYRGLGLATYIYKTLFEYFNKDGVINLTSCIKEIQTEEAKGLWDKIREKYPSNYFEDDNFIYLNFH